MPEITLQDLTNWEITPRSTNVRAVCFVPVGRVSMLMEADREYGWLGIMFNSGHVYAYEDVPYGVYTMVAGAESVGRTFNRFVRGRYSARSLHSGVGQGPES